MIFLGIDTSNYSTSAALVYDDRAVMQTKLLPVKSGEAGLRQSDAVFHHTKQLPEIMKALFEGNTPDIQAIGVSTKPREADGSYMPCFLCGEGLAGSLSAVTGVPLYKTSHQVGHILAALFSAEKTDLLKAPFLAFHVSGGTTDCLYCTPDKERVVRIEQAGTSLDLKAGQLIDRAGIMLGLDFPCGIALEKLAAKADRIIKARPVMKGGDCCLSGFENMVQKLIAQGETKDNTALFAINAVCETVYAMTVNARERYGALPVIYAGGVMSDMLIRTKLETLGDVYFCEPAYSRDNAVGTALFAKLSLTGEI
ncbi:MAG: peptidase M22 [Oscillospiraceae bacterium]|nr:peptidase M22 [Oscillospiraceae bacterium]